MLNDNAWAMTPIQASLFHCLVFLHTYIDSRPLLMSQAYHEHCLGNAAYHESMVCGYEFFCNRQGVSQLCIVHMIILIGATVLSPLVHLPTHLAGLLQDTYDR